MSAAGRKAIAEAQRKRWACQDGSGSAKGKTRQEETDTERRGQGKYHRGAEETACGEEGGCEEIGMDCLACGVTSSPVSGEHVFSDWLLREFKGHRIAIGLHRGNPDGTSQRVRKEYDLDSFRLKKVCTAYNTGWMNDLENVAKPLILGLIRRTLALDDLTEEDRRILAKWAAKTAIIESRAIGAECPIDADHLKRMRASEFPGRFAVAACLTAMQGFGHMQIWRYSGSIFGR